MNQKLFVSNKHIMRIIMHFLHNNFVPIFNIIMWEEICQYPLSLRPTYHIFRENPDAISLVSLALGVMVVMLSSEGD